jgi:hypothetical protein
MRTALYSVGTFVLGGLAFWLPDIALHALRGENFTSVDVVVLTGLLPIMAVVAAVVARRLQGSARAAVYAPLVVALGVWVLGPLAMLISWAPGGGGFAHQDAWLALLVLTAMFPMMTFMMATYDGSLGGLLIGSAALVFLFAGDLARGIGRRAGSVANRTPQ